MEKIDTRYLSIVEAGAAIRSHEVSPVELAEGCFERIRAYDAPLNSFITVTYDLGMAQARQAESELAAGKDRGPLHGIPIALKDLYATRGIRTTAHSEVLVEWMPPDDATATAMLGEAGTSLLGKLAMHEFAAGPLGFDTPFPPARNPWNREHVPGGSSSGSGAALAAGFCYGSLGSDTGGSIRGPAAYCGIVGLKPTYGRVSRYGVVPLSWSLDHAGPMSRTVEDCALLLQAIAGYDPRDGASAKQPVPDFRAGLGDGVRGLRFGVPREWLDEGAGVEDGIRATFEESLRVIESLGSTIVSVDSAPFIAGRDANTLIATAESYSYHEETVRKRPETISLPVRSRFRQGALISAADYIQAQRARTLIRAQVQAIMTDLDGILSPSMPSVAGTFEELDFELNYRRPSFANPFNLTGLPAISVPNGFSGGLPTGLQVAGKAFDEATVLRVAYAYEQAAGWHREHPPL